MRALERDCLSEDTVLKFVDGSLAGSGRTAVETHLACCGACADLVTWAASDLRERTQSLGPSRPVRVGQLPPGSRVGRYQILESVGRGGMGEVYAAYHPDLDRRIALKVVHETGTETAERQARLLREARAIARLSHPNVIAVYDAGTVADRVYVAMEFVEGVTIDRWLQVAPRTVRQILGVFIAAGRGLAAAHAAGLVHRDFKPQNVMIARDGSVRVMDFGLARLASTEESSPATWRAAEEPRPDSGPTAFPTVTRAGTIIGTPAYMAPEQFRGDPADARSDQFSFCVALYEALYGIRPFPGENLLSLTLRVTEGELRRIPSSVTNDVPVRIRRAITRGLQPDPAARFSSMQALMDVLGDDSAVRRRRVVAVGVVATVVVASILWSWQTASRRRAAADREIARQTAEAAQAMTRARTKASEAITLRKRAFAAFDAADRRNGELLWHQVRSLLPVIDADYDRAGRGLETAFTLDQYRAQRRSNLADLRYEHLLFAEDFRLSNKVTLLEERLAAVDPDGSKRKALSAPGELALSTNPTASKILLERYERDPVTGRRRAIGVGPLSVAPSLTKLAPGSYRLLIEGTGLARVIHPFEIKRAGRTTIDLLLPPASVLPKGFVYVPPGTSWYGDGDELLRTQFLDAVPIHQRATGAYLVARHETTYQDWIAFLNDIPPAQRARRAPAVSGSTRGALSLRASADGWRLAFRPSSRRYQASLREPIIYDGRSRRTRQDWLHFPIGGVSPDDVTSYLAWLRESGRLPGARLCTELEWERVARGADDRLFPHGDELAADDANFDLTYDRTDGAFGPDEVGAHPDSRSPFDVDDLAGNIMEMVTSDETPSKLAIRGGGYYFTAASARSTNRLPIPHSFRDVASGFRVCATVTANSTPLAGDSEQRSHDQK